RGHQSAAGNGARARRQDRGPDRHSRPHYSSRSTTVLDFLFLSIKQVLFFATCVPNDRLIEFSSLGGSGIRKQGQSWRRRLLKVLLRCALLAVLFSVTLVVAFRFFPPPVSALMLQRRIETWNGNKTLAPYYKWVQFEQIAPVMGTAVIAAEDQNFFRHHGFDW